MDVMRSVGFAASFLLLSCGSETVPAPARGRIHGDPIVLDGGAARVEIRLDPFGVTLSNASGKSVLQTIADSTHVAGHDAHAYGALGATHHESQFESTVIRR